MDGHKLRPSLDQQQGRKEGDEEKKSLTCFGYTLFRIQRPRNAKRKTLKLLLEGSKAKGITKHHVGERP